MNLSLVILSLAIQAKKRVIIVSTQLLKEAKSLNLESVA